MKSLPTRTKAPARMVAPASGTMNGSDHAPGASTPEAEPASVAHFEAPPRLKLLRFPAIRERTGLSRSTIWRLEHQGRFPPRHWISANAVAWVEEEVVTWIARQVGSTRR